MKKLEYTDIVRIYSNSIINIELKDGTVLKALEFMFYNDVDNPDMEVESITDAEVENEKNIANNNSFSDLDYWA